MTETIFLAKNLNETANIAATLGKSLVLGDFIALKGDLGAGKTAFARALIQSLNPDETEIPSPTFTLVQSYTVPQGALHHLDLYRLGAAEEIYEMGWEELRQGIMLVEWPERLGRLLPPRRITITLCHGAEEEERHITIKRGVSSE